MIRAAASLCLAIAPNLAPGCPAPLPLEVAPEQIAELTRWIERHSDYAASALGPPSIFLCQTGEVIAYEGHDVVVDSELRAAYDLRNDRIFLVLPWSASDPRNLSSLLHELIHRAQFAARDWPCAAATEPEAYRLQEQWLAERGIEAGFNWFRIEIEARCLSDHHP